MQSFATAAPHWARIMELRGAAHAELLRFLGARLPGADADDVAQECYLRLQRYEHLLAVRDPKAFLFRVAVNLLTDRARQHARRQRDLARLRVACNVEDAAEAPCAGSGPDDVLAAEQALRAMAAALECLPAKCRRALLMQRIEGASHEEIAATLRVSKSMVEKYIARAVGALRAALP
jgi:RNA polymerase sigma-70 factor (ECF subfamily)